MWAWGNNASGQLGIGSNAESDLPTQVTSLSSVQAISAGANFSMALASDGTVWTWGDNSYGELGDGTTTQRTVPVQVVGLSGVIAISAGDIYCLAVKSDGTVWGWGYGADGELGGGVPYGQNTPVQLAGVNSIVAVAAGGQHALALGADGTLWGWGTNSRGQLGTGTTSGIQLPALIGSINDVVAIAAGEAHSLALRGDGTVRAWGDNSYGQLSDAATGTSSAVPVEVAGITNAVGIAAGGYFGLAVILNGSIYTWGSNYYGQQGNSRYVGTNAQFQVVPTQVTGITSATAVAGKYQSFIAISYKGVPILLASGANESGELGDGTTTDRAFFSPVLLPFDTDRGGLTDVQDYLLGYDPLNPDTNGIPDWLAVQLGISSLTPNPRIDSNDALPILDPTSNATLVNDPSNTTPPVITLINPRDAVPVQ